MGFDGDFFIYLKKNHWQILCKCRKMRDGINACHEKSTEIAQKFKKKKM